jgi:ribosome-associated toxin RatA of RatAB toxin-antitoxin module
MSEQATETMTVRATPERCWAVVSDFESYPEWAADIKEVTVISRDEQGRGSVVKYRAAAFGRSTTYTLVYDYSAAPKVLAWKLAQGDLEKVLDGSYQFEQVGDDTEITYHLEADLLIPVPGFVKRRAEGRIVHTALKELKVKAESAS